MFNSNTDLEWEKFGKDDPYFGVLLHIKTSEKSHGNLQLRHKVTN